MLLTITLNRKSAEDLSYLLHKHPAKIQQVELSSGLAYIFYPEVSEDKCTCALLLDIDTVGLVRNNKGPSGEGFMLEQYVNDRPYVASSFMSAAIAKAFGTAMNGRCKDRPELVDAPLPLEAKIAVAAVNGGETLLRNLFEPLGYEVFAEPHILDSKFVEWGQSRYFTVTLRNTIPLKTLLSQLYILIPVLDNDKHYFVEKHEMEKLLEKGTGWLESHPFKELITKRYLKHLREWTNEALKILLKEEETEVELEEPESVTPVVEKKVRLHDIRHQTVYETLLELDIKTVVDMGCGEGKLLRMLLNQRKFERIVGMDISWRSLEIAKERLHFERLSERDINRIQLIQGALTYRDQRLAGFDAAVLIEVIEHLDVDRLPALERAVFEFATPQYVILTTPNKDWNITFTEDTSLMRHKDHRFEWTRAEFADWCQKIQEKFSYSFTIKSLGEEIETNGAPSQMAIFKKENA